MGQIIVGTFSCWAQTRISLWPILLQKLFELTDEQ
jgi:hypothetical protein